MDVGHLVAGISGGVISTLILHPLDLVKIRMQVEAKQVLSMTQFARHVLHTRGIKGLYTGCSPNVVASGLAWGSYFFAYNELKRAMRSHEREKLTPLQHTLAASIAGAGTLLITNPLWVIKTRMCTFADGVVPYKGIIDGLSTIVRTEGWKALYKGLLPGLIGVSHGAFQFVAYEELKHYINTSHGRHSEAKLDTLDYLFISACSKAFAVSATYPYQVVRSRLQLAGATLSVGSILSELWRFEGLRGFYKGLLPNLIRVTPATCLTFLVYEHVWRLFHPN